MTDTMGKELDMSNKGENALTNERTNERMNGAFWTLDFTTWTVWMG